MLTIVDTFIGGFPLLFIGLSEILVLMYLYGKLHIYWTGRFYI